jgi:hypothetical protein
MSESPSVEPGWAIKIAAVRIGWNDSALRAVHARAGVYRRELFEESTKAHLATIVFFHPRQLACLSQNATLRRYDSRSSGTPEPPSSTPSALRSMVIGTIGISSGSTV